MMIRDEMIQTTVKLPRSLVERLEGYRKDKELNMSAALRYLVRQGLKTEEGK